MALVHLPEPHKRKRVEVEENSAASQGSRVLQPPPPLRHSGNSTPINYLSRGNQEKLRLIQGDGENLGELLGLMTEYEEEVLGRHESLAANLGAKLTGPRLLKILEKGFEGVITTTPPQSQLQNPISWLDIINFSKSNPEEFTLTILPNRSRGCQFSLSGVQVEIIEDDWRLIASGSLDRFIPTDPLEEDEAAEIATVEILERRLATIIQMSDEVAARARHLNFQLHGRRSEITARRRSSAGSATSGSASRFQPVNNAAGRPSGVSMGGYDLHSDLLAQFNAPSPQTRAPSEFVNTATGAPPPINSIVKSGSRATPPGGRGLWASQASSSQSIASPASDDASSANRSLLTAMVEKLGKGEVINPPCDRCRRLRQQCVKHLTACQGCTRKHAKCTWKAATEDELSHVKKDMGVHHMDDQSIDADVEGDVHSQGYAATRTFSHDEGRGGGGEDVVAPSAASLDDPSRPGSRRSDHGVGMATSRGGGGDGDDESKVTTSRMDIDGAGADRAEASRRNLPTGLPRDANLLGLSTAAAPARDHLQHPFRP